MDKVTWKVSGVLFLASTLIGLMGGLLAAPQSGARTREKILGVYGNIKNQVKYDVHDLKESVNKVAKKGNAYRKHWLPSNRLSNWEKGFLELPSIASTKIIRWPCKETH